MSIPTKKYSAENKDSIVLELIEDNKKIRGPNNSALAPFVHKKEFDNLFSAFSNIQQNHGFCTGLMYLSLSQFDDSVKEALSNESKAELDMLSTIGKILSAKFG